LLFPDEGAFKRYSSKLNRYPIIICHKIRESDQRVVKVKEGDVAGRHVVIVDDLVQTGATLLQCSAALRQLGAAKVSAFVTHAIFPNDSWKQFVHKQNGEKGAGSFQNFWISDSHPVSLLLHDKKPFQVLSCSTIISKVLLDANC